MARVISSNVGRLMACTCPQKWPLSPPKSRYHLPPGHGSIFIGIGLPSAVSLCGPICSSNAANVFSIGALTWISWVMFSVRSSIVCAGRVMLPPCSDIRIKLPSRLAFFLGAFLDSVQLVLPEAFEFARPLVQRPDRLGIGSIELLAAIAAHMDKANVPQDTEVLWRPRAAPGPRLPQCPRPGAPAARDSSVSPAGGAPRPR